MEYLVFEFLLYIFTKPLNSAGFIHSTEKLFGSGSNMGKMVHLASSYSAMRATFEQMVIPIEVS